MVERGLPLNVQMDLTRFLNRIQNADIPQKDKRRLMLVVTEVRDKIKKMENKHNG